MNHFEQIWKLAFPYQDKRRDTGHAQIVTDYAKRLVKIIPCDENVAIPAAILHDIGWSQLSEEERIYAVSPNRDKAREQELRIKHQEEGVRLAHDILEKVHYPQQYVEHILEIIRGHDTRKGFFSTEDGVVRDADKLSLFSSSSFADDVRRGYTPQEFFAKISADRIKPGFLFSQAARDIAAEELLARKKEYGL